MTGDREQMKRVLKSVVVPKIRSLGFTGNFPHFRRKRGSERQMLMLMFNKYGGSFYLEAGRLSESDFLRLKERWTAAGKALSETSLSVGHCRWNQRVRLGSVSDQNTPDNWFVFGPDKYEGKTQGSADTTQYAEIAMQVVKAIESQVERFFANAP